MDLKEEKKRKNRKENLISFRKIRSIEHSIADSLQVVTKSTGNVHQLITEAERVRKLISEAYGEMDTQLENVHTEFEEVRKRQQQIRAKVIEQITKEEPDNLETMTNELDLKIKEAKKAITKKIKSKTKKQREEQRKMQATRVKWAVEAIERNRILEELKTREEYEKQCALREKEQQRKHKALLKENSSNSKLNKSDVASETSDSEFDCCDRDIGPLGVHAVTIKPKSVINSTQPSEDKSNTEDIATDISKLETPCTSASTTTKVNAVAVSKDATNLPSNSNLPVSKSNSKVAIINQQKPIESQYKKFSLIKHTKLKSLPLYVREFKATIIPEEFEQIPKFLRGSESFLELRNFLYNTIIPCFNEKYEILERERTKIHDRKELERWKIYNRQIEYIPGREFITKNDVRQKLEYFDKKIKHRLSLLIYLGILQDLHFRQNTCYIWTVISE